MLTEAIKEQQSIIKGQEEVINSLEEVNDNQNKMIDKLEERLSQLEQFIANTTTSPGIDVNTLNNTRQATLSQNQPNPFSDFTTINYTLPADANNAKLVVYDLNGKTIQIFNLIDQQGNIEFNASGLSSGTYIYALLVDGVNLAREKMVIK